MPLHSSISAMAAAPAAAASSVTSEEFFAGKAAPVLERHPGVQAPAAPTGALPKAPAPRAAASKAPRKPKTAKPVTPSPLMDDVRATRVLLAAVEKDMQVLQEKAQAAVAKFAPRREKLQARYVELSAQLAKALTK